MDILVDLSPLHLNQKILELNVHRLEKVFPRNSGISLKPRPFMKGVHIRSFSGPYFPAFGLNTVSVFGVFLLRVFPYSVRIQNYGPKKFQTGTLFTQCGLILYLF